MTNNNFRFIGNFDVLNIVDRLKDLNWNYFTWRQENRPGLKYTETIPLIWENNFKYYNAWEYLDSFKDELEKLKVLITEDVGPGDYITAVFTKLYAGYDISPHIDIGQPFRDNPRIHIPIVTNNDCLFTVGNETVNMKVGEMWEINNFNKVHSVHNRGVTDRVHLMIDWKLTNP